MLLRSSKDLDPGDCGVSTNDTVLEQSDEVKTLIDEMNEEYPFWRPHRDEEYPVDLIHASTKEEHYGHLIGVLNCT